MSKKNSSVNLKNGFKEFKDLSNIFLNFKNKIDNLNKKNLLVAVSGGPDSLALTALAKAYSHFRKINLHYVLLNHNIRKNSAQEAKIVKDLLKREKINLKILLNKKKITKNIQAEARNARYKIISNYCKKRGINTILTAHNLEDQVETFFIRLSRGSGLKGLSSMRPLSKLNNKVYLYRPLLDVKKKYLIKISKKIFGKYIKDPSNADSKYLRTKVRNLKKSLEKSGIKYEQIFRSIQNLSSSRVTLEQYINNILNDLIKKNNKTIFVNLKKFKDLNDEMKIALINESIKKLRKNYYDLRSSKVVTLIKNLKKKDHKKSTLGGCIFFKKGENLCLEIEKIKKF
tara:strand:- start:1175 stop:2203 length:1029 start_codon:yes stop_codon:yes gene_type:complete